MDQYFLPGVSIKYWQKKFKLLMNATKCANCKVRIRNITNFDLLVFSIWRTKWTFLIRVFVVLWDCQYLEYVLEHGTSYVVSALLVSQNLRPNVAFLPRLNMINNDRYIIYEIRLTENSKTASTNFDVEKKDRKCRWMNFIRKESKYKDSEKYEFQR